MYVYLRYSFNHHDRNVKNQCCFQECGYISSLLPLSFPSVSTRGGQWAQLIFGLWMTRPSWARGGDLTCDAALLNPALFKVTSRASHKAVYGCICYQHALGGSERERRENVG